MKIKHDDLKWYETARGKVNNLYIEQYAKDYRLTFDEALNKIRESAERSLLKLESEQDD